METPDLEREFLADHRLVTQGIIAVLDALRSADLNRARTAAGELDRLAGPHMHFEESALYPRLREWVDIPTLSRMYAEHRGAQTVLRHLEHRDPERPLDPAESAAWIDAMETALRHTEACGALLGKLAGIAELERAELLRKLVDCREEARRWTELPPAGPAAPP